MSLIAKAKSFAKTTPLYTAYRAVVDGHRMRCAIRDMGRWTALDDKRKAMYRQFIGQGDLVFDVGANMGNRVKIFVALGAKVVAVEPQKRCVAMLENNFGSNADVEIVNTALGASPGTASLRSGIDHMIASLSEDWMNATRASGRFAGNRWRRSEDVAIDTFDSLIDMYGEPVFAKVDVEGYEQHVLKGLSRPIRSLSIEFLREHLVNTRNCLERLRVLGVYEFQVSLGESMEFLLSEWVEEDEMNQVLTALPQSAFGDVYARRMD